MPVVVAAQTALAYWGKSAESCPANQKEAVRSGIRVRGGWRTLMRTTLYYDLHLCIEEDLDLRQIDWSSMFRG